MSVKVSAHEKTQLVKFDRPCLLLVEGVDDQAFAARQLRQFSSGDDWQVHNMGGNRTGWGPALEVILDDDYFMEEGRAIGIIGDADSDAEAVCQRFHNILRERQLPAPRSSGEVMKGERYSTGFFVFPDGVSGGELEDLLLLSAEPERMRLAEQYLSTVEALPTVLRKRSKNKLQSYMAGYSDFAKTLYVGLSQRPEMFPVDPPAFNQFSNFLRALVS